MTVTLVACGTALATPVVSAVTPNAGLVTGGQLVTVRGSGFSGASGSCRASTVVWFGQDSVYRYAIAGGAPSVVSDNQIQVQAPASLAGTVDVHVTDACGTSAATGADAFTFQYPAGQCLSGACAMSVSPTPAGVIQHTALGLLDGLNTDSGVTIPAATRNLVLALHPRQWRFGQSALGGGEFQLARDSGATISLDLTSDWENWAYTSDRRAWQAPYLDLPTYSAFIASDVRRRLAAGQSPDYYDVWNEPEPPGTVNQWLSVFGAAYQAIKSASPSAKIVGPSLSKFLVQSAGTPDLAGAEMSLTDFLSWEQRTGDHFDAISWHEDGATVGTQALPGGQFSFLGQAGGLRDAWSPNAFAAHVMVARQLLSTYPSLAGTQVFVNEYGPPFSANVPGWIVGDAAALESSGADEAMLTCVSQAACTNQLDGLVAPDGTPQMPYWVMSAYSQMSGDRLAVTSPSSNLYGIAAEQPAKVQVLLGRADDCFGGACPQFQASGHASANVTVTVPVPSGWRAASVSVTDYADSAHNALGANPVPVAPVAVTGQVLSTSCGSITVALPGFADGDARLVTVSSGGAQSLAPCSAGSGSTSTQSAAPGKSASAGHAQILKVFLKARRPRQGRHSHARRRRASKRPPATRCTRTRTRTHSRCSATRRSSRRR